MISVPVQQRNISIWTQIPYLAPADIRSTIWQKPLVAVREIDVGAYLQALLERLSDTPGDRSKVAVVTSIKKGVGVSTVARSLNLAALKVGNISVLIEAETDAFDSRGTRISAEARTVSGSRSSHASLRSIRLLLAGGASSSSPPVEDIRSEFDLIVIDAPPLTVASEVTPLLTLADVVLVVLEHGAADPAAIHDACALLPETGSVPVGLVVNQVSPPQVQARAQNSISQLAG